MERQIDKYVELVIQKGINIQKGQILVISSPVEVYDFTRKLVKQAYELGASEVVVHWNDEVVGKYKYVYGAEDIFDTFPEWQKESMEYYRKKGAAFLSVYATDPDILKEVDKTRVARFQKAKSLALKEYYENVMGNSNQWCYTYIYCSYTSLGKESISRIKYRSCYFRDVEINFKNS